MPLGHVVASGRWPIGPAPQPTGHMVAPTANQRPLPRRLLMKPRPEIDANLI